MDFMTVPTVRFQLLYVWFVLDHDRRRLIHYNVTTSPAAGWVIQQLREAFPSEDALPFLLYYRDSIFSADVTATIQHLGIEPVRTAYRCPWQNPFAERWVGTCRRELLDHVIVLGERLSGGSSPSTSTTTTSSGSTRPCEIHPMSAPPTSGLRRARSRSPARAWAASTIGTHGARRRDSVALGPPEARDEF
jgi:transposase InsO family protein